MYTLRLFHRDDPFCALDARQIALGEISIGRDFESDWVVADPERTVSRRHAVFKLDRDGLTVRDVSANGVFRDPGHERLPLNQDVASRPGDVFRFGHFIVSIAKDEIGASELAPPFVDTPAAANDMTMGFSQSLRPRTAQRVSVPSEWSAVEPASEPAAKSGEYGLLEAFCAGARLDPSVFAHEDAHDVLRRAGAFYRQGVLGLSDLIEARGTMKSDFALERTTIGSVGNNPIKWAAPQRLAVDLLCGGDGPFLKDAAAANEAFADIKKHVVSLTASLRVALDSLLAEIAPAKIKSEAPAKGLAFTGDADRWWKAYERRFDEITDPAKGRVEQHIRTAYQASLADFD
jgi:predicted component of type VI protein secretion system